MTSKIEISDHAGLAIRILAKVRGTTIKEAVDLLVKNSATIKSATKAYRVRPQDFQKPEPAPAPAAEPPAPTSPPLRDPLGAGHVPKRILVTAQRVRRGEPTNVFERKALKEWMLGDDDAERFLPPEESPAPPGLDPYWEETPSTPTAPYTSFSTPGSSPALAAAPSAAGPSPSAPPPPPPEPPPAPEPPLAPLPQAQPDPPTPRPLARRDALAADAPAWVKQIVALFGDGIDVPPETMATFRAWQRGEEANPEGRLLIEEERLEGEGA